MTWVHDTLADYGRRLGLSEFGLNEQGVARLRLESGAHLAVEPVRRGTVDEVLVYLSRPLSHEADTWLRRALEKAHGSRGGLRPVQVASLGEGSDTQLLMLVRLPEREFTAQALNHAVDHLVTWFNDLDKLR